MNIGKCIVLPKGVVSIVWRNLTIVLDGGNVND